MESGVQVVNPLHIMTAAKHNNNPVFCNSWKITCTHRLFGLTFCHSWNPTYCEFTSKMKLQRQKLQLHMYVINNQFAVTTLQTQIERSTVSTIHGIETWKPLLFMF